MPVEKELPCYSCELCIVATSFVAVLIAASLAITCTKWSVSTRYVMPPALSSVLTHRYVMPPALSSVLTHCRVLGAWESSPSG